MSIQLVRIVAWNKNSKRERYFRDDGSLRIVLYTPKCLSVRLLFGILSLMNQNWQRLESEIFSHIFYRPVVRFREQIRYYYSENIGDNVCEIRPAVKHLIFPHFLHTRI